MASSSPLDFRRLRYFCAIAEHGSFSAAARTLNLAQPALTHHIQELEGALAAPLFRRSTRGIELTDIGQVLLRRAHGILDEVARSEEEVRAAVGKAVATRPVRIAIMSSKAAMLTPLLVAAVARELPHVALHLIEARTSQSRSMIERKEVDLALSVSDRQHPNGDILVSERLILVRAAGQADPERRQIRFAEMARLPLILPCADNRLRQAVEETAREVGVPLNVALEIDGFESRRQATLAGLGGTIMPWHAVRHDCMAGLLMAQRIVEPAVWRRIVLDRRPGFDRSLAMAMRNILARLLEDTVEDEP
jgi:LysR family nitrogen assimilation transcriptional regulator